MVEQQFDAARQLPIAYRSCVIKNAAESQTSVSFRQTSRRHTATATPDEFSH
jgi:hypothetical protein